MLTTHHREGEVTKWREVTIVLGLATANQREGFKRPFRHPSLNMSIEKGGCARFTGSELRASNGQRGFRDFINGN